MSRWSSFDLSLGLKAPGPLVNDGVEELPDFYRMLDPLFANKKRDYGGVYPRYRDEEGVFHHPTYRPFPPLIPPPKKLPPDERPTYVERMRPPPPEELPPTDPVPKVPPWKQHPRLEHKKKKKKQSNRTRPFKTPEIVETETSVVEAAANIQELPGEIQVPDVDHEDSEQECYVQFLVQAKQMFIGLIKAVSDCIHGHPTPPLQL